MHGISRTVGVPEAAVLALAAGADALCLGHDLHEEAVEQVHAAIVGAVRSGRLAEERLAEAARACRGHLPLGVADGCRRCRPRGRRRGCAPRARRLRRRSRSSARSSSSSSCRRRTSPPARRCTGSRTSCPTPSTVRLDEAPADLAALLAAHEGRRLVARRPRRRSACVAGGDGGGGERRCARMRSWSRPGFPGGGASIVTHGAGRANLVAAAAALSG